MKSDMEVCATYMSGNAMQEHASICPKTGKNFADNLSVYCHVLSSLAFLNKVCGEHPEICRVALRSCSQGRTG